MKTVAQNKKTGGKLLLAEYDGEMLKRFIEDCGGKENVIFEDETIKSFKKESHLKELELLIKQKTTGLKKLAINKPWMQNSEAVNDQYRVYEEMYKSAKNGNYDNATNEAIIQANEASKALVAPVLLLLNSVRGVIEKAILENSDNVDELLIAARSVNLTKEELSSEKVAEIKASFGLE